MREYTFDEYLDGRIELPITAKEDGWWLLAIPVPFLGKWHELSAVKKTENRFMFAMDRYAEEIDCAFSFIIDKGNLKTYNMFSKELRDVLLKVALTVSKLDAIYQDEKDVDLFDTPVWAGEEVCDVLQSQVG